MDLQHLSDIHTGRYAQRVQNDVERTSVRQKRHILYRKHAGNNTLVTMAACHLIAYGDLTLLSDIDADSLVHTGSQLIAVLSGKYLGIHNDAVSAVRHF